MMNSKMALANKVIERILKLSADAEIRRRLTVKDSSQFHKLTGAIAAYGKALALLAALQQREEFYAMMDDHRAVPARAATGSLRKRLIQYVA
jgi:hypothetical protein